MHNFSGRHIDKDVIQMPVSKTDYVANHGHHGGRPGVRLRSSRKKTTLKLGDLFPRSNKTFLKVFNQHPHRITTIMEATVGVRNGMRMLSSSSYSPLTNVQKQMYAPNPPKSQKAEDCHLVEHVSFTNLPFKTKQHYRDAR